MATDEQVRAVLERFQHEEYIADDVTEYLDKIGGLGDEPTLALAAALADAERERDELAAWLAAVVEAASPHVEGYAESELILCRPCLARALKQTASLLATAESELTKTEASNRALSVQLSTEDRQDRRALGAERAASVQAARAERLERALREAEKAIASLPGDALGIGGGGHEGATAWYLRDELLTEIRRALGEEK